MRTVLYRVAVNLPDDREPIFAIESGKKTSAVFVDILGRVFVKARKIKVAVGNAETPPSRVEKPFVNPAVSSGTANEHLNTISFSPIEARYRLKSVFLAIVEPLLPQAVLTTDPMIFSTGIDIVEVYRIRETIARTPRFAERVFTAGERAYCDSKGAAAFQSYAGRFAAKEAF